MSLGGLYRVPGVSERVVAYICAPPSMIQSIGVDIRYKMFMRSPCAVRALTTLRLPQWHNFAHKKRIGCRSLSCCCVGVSGSWDSAY